MSESRSHYSKVVESGAFIRTTFRKGNKRKTETKKFEKNHKKVVLGFIGDFEVYCYPYDYPEKVFIGKFPVSTTLDNSNILSLFRNFNKCRAFLNGNYFDKPKKSKEANSTRQSIQTAYNLGLNEQRSKKQGDSH